MPAGSGACSTAMPDFGLNSWTLGDAPTPLAIVAAAGQAGYRFVELRDVKIEQHLAEGGTLRGLKEEAGRAGVGILTVNTLDDATLQSGDGLAQMVERCRRLCGWAAALDCRTLVVGPSYLAEPGGDRAMIADRTADALARYADVAAGHGVRIGFEFHGYARCSINTLGDALAVLDRLDDPRIGVIIDAFHFHVGGSSLADLAGLDPGRLLVVHLADVDHDDRATLGKGNRVMPGDGVLPLAPLVEAVRRTGYTGPYSLELFRPEYWAMDPVAVARRGLESMRTFV